MSYTLPTFVLDINIWRPGVFPGAPSVVTKCQLRFGRMVTTTGVSSTIGNGSEFYSFILLPKLTDIRDSWRSINNDLVEVPAGTGRYYVVEYVEDVAKGFDNEHRAAVLRPESGLSPGGHWPEPYP